MTHREFRDIPDKVAELRLALEQPIIREAMEILKDDGPENNKQLSDISPTFAAVRLGTILGYAHYSNKLRELAIQPPVEEKIEASYEEET